MTWEFIFAAYPSNVARLRQERIFTSVVEHLKDLVEGVVVLPQVGLYVDSDSGELLVKLERVLEGGWRWFKRVSKRQLEILELEQVKSWVTKNLAF